MLRNRAGLRVLAAILACGSAADAAAAPVEIRTRMIEAFGGGPGAEGRLGFLGGLVLTGPPGFGALSGLLVAEGRVLAASDTGMWFSARLVGSAGRPLALEDTELSPRRSVDGRAIRTKEAGDAEALTLVEGGVVVAVESSAQLLRYPADGIAIDPDAVPERLEISPRLYQSGRRHGLEALATTVDGTVVAIVEGTARSGPALQAFRVGGEEFAIARDGDWSITGADRLPGGDMVIVERHYGGGIDIAMRVRRIGLWDLAEATGPLGGPVLMEAGFAAQIDNMEAVAASFEDGRTVLTFLSDDNMSVLQRTLLLRFSIREPLPRRKPGRAQTVLWPDIPRAAQTDLTAER